MECDTIDQTAGAGFMTLFLLPGGQGEEQAPQVYHSCRLGERAEHALQRIAVCVGAVSVPGGGAACQKALYGASVEIVKICGHRPNHPQVYYDLFCLGEVQTEVVVLPHR